MTPHALYLIGPPGAGKSTVLRAALAEWHWCGRTLRPLAHHVVVADPAGRLGAPFVVVLGDYDAARGAFPGTDAWSFTAIDTALAWLQADLRPTLLLGEGDRVACDRFFRALARVYQLTVVYLDVPPAVQDARRALRTQRTGHRQPVTWARSRAAKALKLAHTWTPDPWWLDGTLPVAELAARLRTHPLFAGAQRSAPLPADPVLAVNPVDAGATL